ncbi:MarR family winged helix-turn-helix transcriptional regulator [Brevibacterium jeotgali]|uniref:DNA-binding transcriptional regulator, MarR family n=1 Tax=Brevibacterium jeotgali TaxID=1262550 RepID=A0A2H1L843_9MICO|nr:MarR family transcriptional regulator [Brevibacterium jeotgali]TWC03379.1 DNA-binding MarR family transcriptional regulator [Brevibacterium jeotgali]SMY13042.1 DNA-binding transcriptional regulator, MarR family [Brevibacterium jeotgali]
MDAHPGEHDRSGYWFADSDTDASSVEVLNLLRRYREAETAMRARVREDMGMGERDILALRFLLEARATGTVLRQKDIADKLDITTASASNLIDRLVRDGYAQRTPHPADRRSVAVEATDDGDREVRETLRRMHDRMYAATTAMDAQERAVVAVFLRRMIASVSTDDHAGDDGHTDHE